MLNLFCENVGATSHPLHIILEHHLSYYIIIIIINLANCEILPLEPPDPRPPYILLYSWVTYSPENIPPLLEYKVLSIAGLHEDLFFFSFSAAFGTDWTDLAPSFNVYKL